MSTARSPIAKSAENRPPTRAAARRKTYLYAIIAGGEDRVYEEAGIDQSKLYSISAGPIAAVVSDVAGERLRPERARLAAHHQVLKKLMAESTPLPMSFGIVADSPAAVRRMLARNQQVLLAQLQQVAGKVEMGLRVSWDVDNIFEYFVNTHPELRIARDRLLASGGQPTHQQKIEVGRMFDRLLNQERDAHTDLAMEMFAGHGVGKQAPEMPPGARSDESGLPGRARGGDRVRSGRVRDREAV